MKIIITGANSAVGRAILRRGRKDGESSVMFVAAVRSGSAAEKIRDQLGQGDAVASISYDDPRCLDAAFQGTAAVIHLAGILVERPDSSYEHANVESTRSVVESAKRAAVQKFVLVSATGADEASSNRYYRSKGQAEALVRASGLCYTVLRVPRLLGRGTASAEALQRNVSSGSARLIGGGRNLEQPLDVSDVARAAVLAATRSSVACNLTLHLVGPVSLPQRELVDRAAHLSGREVRISSIPKGFLSLMLAIRERICSPGFSRDALEVITADTRFDSESAAGELGIQLTGIEEMIKESLESK